ncbi:TPA: thioredoxin family protein [Streptococcus suis]|uniref:thioredoxin family protein n=1 Tax=Streptococcus suis TaxID=1307 RepID=UPI000CF369B1|nr:thioredoxin family protein [Streptococcus suis]MCK3941738.1 thioredoxin family protein [Streptococcus suis]NQI70496.1 thioredoxin family protein [Streptococcus suis]HEM4128848.1 thioredoxin family protein [Streptococcus suis]
MIKKFVSCICLLLCLVIFYACKPSQEAKSEVITSTQSISLEEVEEKIRSREDFYLYVGRPTCPYCQKFFPNLEKAIQDTQVPVYYLNTDEESSDPVKSFVSSQNIQTVPHLTFYQNGEKQTYLEKGSQTPLEEIEQFLKQY